MRQDPLFSADEHPLLHSTLRVVVSIKQPKCCHDRDARPINSTPVSLFHNHTQTSRNQCTFFTSVKKPEPLTLSRLSSLASVRLTFSMRTSKGKLRGRSRSVLTLVHFGWHPNSRSFPGVRVAKATAFISLGLSSASLCTPFSDTFRLVVCWFLVFSSHTRSLAPPAFRFRACRPAVHSPSAARGVKQRKTRLNKGAELPSAPTAARAREVHRR